MIVTNEAITTIKAGMRTLSGMMFLMSEITRFDMISTAVVASPMPMPFAADVVVPSVGHMPSTSTNVGLFRTIPLKTICNLFIMTSFLNLRFVGSYSSGLFLTFRGGLCRGLSGRRGIPGRSGLRRPPEATSEGASPDATLGKPSTRG